MFYRILADPSEGILRNKAFFYLVLLRYSIVDFTEINAVISIWIMELKNSIEVIR